MVNTRHYCLYCYTPFLSTGNASQRCPECARIHVRVDQALYWSREPALISMECSVKAIILLFLALFYWVLIKTIGMGAHRINTFLIGPMVLLGGVLWWTAGLITRKPRYFSARLLWGLVIGLLIVAPPVLLFVMDLVAHRASFGAAYWKASFAMMLPGIPMLIIGIALHFLGRRFERFKRARIESVSVVD
ncbi:MAG: hypothetical protein ACI8X5_003818 [Planctomycetota bacterium]|jgi:hypothetical protein